MQLSEYRSTRLHIKYTNKFHKGKIVYKKPAMNVQTFTLSTEAEKTIL